VSPRPPAQRDSFFVAEFDLDRRPTRTSHHRLLL
jgi:hypothetical protein